MALKFAEGFETSVDDSDIRARGWLFSPTKRYAGLPPSKTSAVGSIGLRRFVNNGSDAATAVGATGAADIGYYNTGITVNQAWTAGGFTFGSSATHYSGSMVQVGATGTTGPSGQALGCIDFDGTNYWACTSATKIAKSTDLNTWTNTTAQPTGITLSSTVSYMGSGVVVVVPQTSTPTTLAVSYTSNGGTTWSTQTLATGISTTTGAQYGIAFPTGNATYPHGILIGISDNSAANGLYIGTLGGTFVQVVGGTAYTMGFFVPRPVVINGYIYASDASNNATTAGFYSAPVSGAINTPGAWTKWSVGNIPNPSQIAYFQSANLFLVSSVTNGLYTIPNTGGSGTPVPPTTATTASNPYVAAGVYGIAASSSTAVIFPDVFNSISANNTIFTSTDAATWTPQFKIWPDLGGTNRNGWCTTFYDGTQYVAVGSVGSAAHSQIICTTDDGVNNWRIRYASDTSSNGTTGGFSGLGVCTATAAPVSGSTWTVGTSGAWLNATVPSAGSSTISFYTTTNSATAASTAAVTTTGALTHYYEIKAVATATANTFNISWYVDGTLKATSSGVLLGSSTSDTTSLLILNMPRCGAWQQFDDMYLTLDNGTGLQGPAGPIYIAARRPTTDVQDQWSPNGTATNSLATNQTGLSSRTNRYSSTFTDGAKDIYSSTDSTPSSYKVKAVQIEGYFSQLSTVAPTAKLSLISNGNQVDATTVTVNTSQVYTSTIVEQNPNGNVAWTPGTVNSSQFAITKVT